MSIAIVTDSSAYLSTAEINELNIKVIPTPVIIDDVVYQEGVDLSADEFYEKLRTAKTFPSTSQPSLGDTLKAYEDLANEGYDTVLSIHLSSTISGFYNTLVTMTPNLKTIKVIPYDSGITIRLMGYLVLKAAIMAHNGASVQEIITQLDQLKQTMNEVFIVNDLQNLVRGGRLSNASAFIGTMLKIKPLLTFDAKSNKIVAFEKVRSIKKAYARAEELFANDYQQAPQPLRLLIVHANDLVAAQAWETAIHAKFPDLTTEITYFGPAIGTHLGEKAIALAWMADIYC
ncbi:DegV family protein [Lapidilactobacillus mulanensis]|uniref:DegV family protein n=1 Tax=Lapidilactobacillus mulanensis TaxID=2485999 RepID=A0ABW4DRY6_9LACO|nr:DegV family protein [Lapidilactobacillus mulanensis]